MAGTLFPMPEPQAGDRYTTPWDLVRALPEYPFSLDPCADEHTAKAPCWFSKVTDGLHEDWWGKVFCNPPYSRVVPWINKAISEVQERNASIVVMLLKGDTSTGWFHDLVLPYGDVEFVRGRVRFNGKKPPWPSILVRFTKETMNAG